MTGVGTGSELPHPSFSHGHLEAQLLDHLGNVGSGESSLLDEDVLAYLQLCSQA